MASAIFFLDLKGKVHTQRYIFSAEGVALTLQQRPSWLAITEEIFPCRLWRNSPYSSATQRKRAPPFPHVFQMKE
jgi:hypothetical protein